MYDRFDLFDQDEFSILEEAATTGTFSRVAKVSVSILSLFLFVLLLALQLFHIDPPTRNLGAAGATTLLLYALSSFGWSEAITGSNYLLTQILLLVFGVVAEVSFSYELSRQTAKFRKAIKQLRLITHFSRQIYPGSGSLAFSYGSKGFFVSSGRNIGFTIKWDAFWFLELVKKTDQTSRGLWPIVRKSRSIQYQRIETQDAGGATHALLYLKEADIARARTEDKTERIEGLEYLVVPRRFFLNERNSRSWTDFVGGLQATGGLRPL